MCPLDVSGLVALNRSLHHGTQICGDVTNLPRCLEELSELRTVDNLLLRWVHLVYQVLKVCLQHSLSTSMWHLVPLADCE